jgi:hypothetical protein
MQRTYLEALKSKQASLAEGGRQAVPDAKPAEKPPVQPRKGNRKLPHRNPPPSNWCDCHDELMAEQMERAMLEEEHNRCNDTDQCL